MGHVDVSPLPLAVVLAFATSGGRECSRVMYASGVAWNVRRQFALQNS
jgi:hypothetical protein